MHEHRRSGRERKNENETKCIVKCMVFVFENIFFSRKNGREKEQKKKKSECYEIWIVLVGIFGDRLGQARPPVLICYYYTIATITAHLGVNGACIYVFVCVHLYLWNGRRSERIFFPTSFFSKSVNMERETNFLTFSFFFYFWSFIFPSLFPPTKAAAAAAAATKLSTITHRQHQTFQNNKGKTKQ